MWPPRGGSHSGTSSGSDLLDRGALRARCAGGAAALSGELAIYLFDASTSSSASSATGPSSVWSDPPLPGVDVFSGAVEIAAGAGSDALEVGDLFVEGRDRCAGAERGDLLARGRLRARLRGP
ncbi:unnamed protein product [Prorocentrum cordatum]|uniref:Uncharacterized protein n=1 Tax=Prorocentrum cordatum TaxID=2364126 RepID=A0ABN9SQR3_9DINO|nr:unnamed protein product [Polarella glacialis]